MTEKCSTGDKTMARIRQTTLTRFVKDECANYDKHYQECLSGGECKIFNGERCGYFEKSVLGPSDYPYRRLIRSWFWAFEYTAILNSASYFVLF